MRTPFLLIALLPLAAAASDTRSFRCKQDIVSIGDSRATVLQRCGEPAFRDSFCAAPPLGQPDPGSPPASHALRRPRGCDEVQEWTYNPGWGQFWTTMRFQNGELVSIRYGDRVK